MTTRNTKSAGIAFTDQYLEGGDMVGYNISGATIVSSTITGNNAITGTTVTATTLVVTTSAAVGNTTTATVGFYGTSPIAKRASSNQGAVTTTASASISATQWGFSTSTQADTLTTLVAQMRADLVALGLIKGSA